MKKLLHPITDWVSTKRGMWTTLIVWLVVTIALAGLAPSAKKYEASNIKPLPDDAASVMAEKQLDTYFKEDKGIPTLLVFHHPSGEIDLKQVAKATDQIASQKIKGVKETVPFSKLPPQAQAKFISEDKTTALIPVNLDSDLEAKEIQNINKEIITAAEKSTNNLIIRATGPAGIAGDTLALFSRADIVLLLSTVGLILILLIVIYRSPLLALIPLLAASFVYEVVNQTLGLMGKAGLEIHKQSLSIMTILLFAALIDYSLFVFSRFREELKHYESKFEAMKYAMRETGEPVFFSGGTVFAAMLVLLFANFRDYQNFAPIFGTTMLVIMLASITLVPALFTLFGRRSFWPKIPRVGEEEMKQNSFWNKIGRFITRKPALTSGLVLLVLVISALNVFNMKYEFDTVKSFPKDMPSREGYELVEAKFDKGELAPTSVIFHSNQALTEDQVKILSEQLSKQKHVASIRPDGTANGGKVIKYRMTFDESPYSLTTLDALEQIRNDAPKIVKDAQLNGDLFFAGETASQVDERAVNNRDLFVIVALETLLILVLLFFLTRSIKMPIYMMATILVSFLSALGLGTFLTDLLFEIDAINTRVPIYSFVFLAALGIDYNIILASRFMEERQKHPVKKAVEIAVAHTGGVISSAGILLAATFAVLMTQPITILFVFGFVVAVGILLDTFLVRGLLLPSLMVLFEKDQQKEVAKA